LIKKSHDTQLSSKEGTGPIEGVQGATGGSNLEQVEVKEKKEEEVGVDVSSIMIAPWEDNQIKQGQAFYDFMDDDSIVIPK
jgi:hypothetical protein